MKRRLFLRDSFASMLLSSTAVYGIDSVLLDSLTKLQKERDIFQINGKYGSGILKEISSLNGNPSSNNNFAQIDGNQVVWQGWSENTSHIYLYDGTEISRISTLFGNESSNNQKAQIDGRFITWSGHDGQKLCIYLYDGEKISNLSLMSPYNSISNMSPQLDGGKVVWSGYDGDTYHIYLYDGNQVMNISSLEKNMSLDNHMPLIEGNNIVWRGYDGNSHHIYQFDGEKINKISSLGQVEITENRNHKICNNKMVWNGSDGTTFNTYLFDGTQVLDLSSMSNIPITDNGNVQIDDNYVYWIGHEGKGYFAFQFDGETVQKISAIQSNNPPCSIEWKIGNQQVVWGDLEGKTHIIQPSDKLKSSTDTSEDIISAFYHANHQIDGKNLVWTSYDDHTSHIYMMVQPEDIQSSIITDKLSDSVESSGIEGSMIRDNRVFPNPFVDWTTIRFHLIENSEVEINVFNLAGQKVQTILQLTTLEKGEHSIKWQPRGLISGTYYSVVEIGDRQVTNRIVYI